MKRLLLLLTALLFLAACGSNSEEELNTFIESFNENAVTSPAVHLLNEGEFGSIDNDLQKLDEVPGKYELYAKYDGDDLTGYQLKVHDESYGESVREVMTKTGEYGIKDNGTTIDFDKASE